jgi:hypothetical protein
MFSHLTMKIVFFPLLGILLTALALGASAIQPEVGASYFELHNARFEPAPTPLSVDEPSKGAPFIAVTHDFTDRFGFRLSYHHVNNLRATAQFGSPPGSPPSPLAVVVWGHYHDDVHLLSAAPEFKWSFSPKLTFAIAPQLSWVASRGVVSYSTTNALIQLIGPRKRHQDGFTLGGSARFLWSLGHRSAVSVGYQYVDLNPSFDREAHVFSGGVRWRF